MKKRGIGAERLVIIIAIVIAAIVFLTVLWPGFSQLLTGAGKQAECNWNLFLAAIVKAGSLGFAEIPAGCQAEYITVDSEMLEDRYTLAKKRIGKYHADATGTYSAAKEEFPADSNGNPTYDAMNEWALDSIMAKEMQQCADKVWHGKLDLVTRWKVTTRQFCIVCSVMRFSDDLPIVVNKKSAVTSLYDQMNAEPYFKTTYFDYAFDGVVKPPSEEYLAYSTKVPLAVVYTEQMPSWFERLWRPALVGVTWAVAGGVTIATFGAAGPVAIGSAALVTGAIGGTIVEASVTAGQPYKFLVLWPYETLQRNPEDGGLGCTDIIA